ncbi:hypothetical protein [Amycolatopsis sp. NPDC051903]|uniref:hypothetical protein n=1 Tax=Amycolatopsis sp. NPDC051903 TaxID=3363936 RepID=UPI0037AE9D94
MTVVPPERAVPHQLSRAVPRLVGRDDEVGLRAAGNALVVLTDGLRGIGRRAFARYLARQLSRSFSGGEVYLDLSTFLVDGERLIPSALRAILRAVGVADRRYAAGSGTPHAVADESR